VTAYIIEAMVELSGVKRVIVLDMALSPSIEISVW